MRKIVQFLTLAVLLAAPWGGYFNQVQAQATLTVANGTATNQYVPLYFSYADENQHNQVIYPASELTEMQGKAITQMQFYSNTTDWEWDGTCGTWVVSMGITASTTLSSPDNSTSLTQVYTTGTINVTSGNIIVVFDNGFTYTGGNLLVDFNYTSAGGYAYDASTYDNILFYGENQAGNAAYCYDAARNFLPKTTFTYETPAACAKPTALAASSVTTTGATLSWTAVGSETSWTVEYGTAADFTGAVSQNVATTPTLNLTGLTANTTYYFRVKAVCSGSDESNWSNTASFMTSCVAVASFPWNEDFESATADAVPTCWDNSASTSSTLSSYPERIWGVYSYSGNKMLRMYNYYVSSGTALINTPPLTLPSTGDYQFTFDYSHRASCGAFTVKISTDGGTSFTDLQTYASTGSNDYTNPGDFTEATLSLASYMGQTVILQFFSTANYGSGAIFLDNIRVGEAPSCLKPTDVTCSATTTTTATLGWTETGTATAWQICLDGDEANPIDAATNPFTLTGLTPATTYTVKVRANCGANGYSDWSNAASFTTECAAIAALGYTQNFDALTTGNNVLPLCWSYINTTTYSSYQGYPKAYNYSSHSASNCLYFYSYYSSYYDYYDPQPQYAILPEMTGLAGKQVTLWAKGSYATSTFKIGTMTDPADASTFTLITEQALTTSYQEFEYIVPTTTDAYLAIMIDAASSSRTTNGVYIDDISIAEPPTCPKPSALMLNEPTARTAHTATLKWTNGDAETAWQIVYSTESTFNPTVDLAGAIPVDVTTNPATITGLNANTTYYAFIRANCGGGDFSAWSSSYANFTTYTGVRVPTGLAVDNATLSPYAATVTWTGDAANDLHDSYELFYSQNSTPSPNNETVPSFTDIDTESKLIAGLTPGTTYYVWVRDNCGADGISAWTSPVVSFTTPEVCPAPTGVTVSSATAHGATISWTGTSDSYNVYVGKVTSTIDDVTYDFEDAISPNFTNDATRPWTVTTAAYHGGAKAVKSGGANSASSNLTLTVTVGDGATITFWDKVSSEESYDKGIFLIDGVEKYTISGETSWTQRTYPLTAGSHTLVWRYTKDVSDYDGDDCYYVDDITVTNIVTVDVPSWERYEAPASPYVLFDDGNIDPETDYAVKVVGVCESVESTHESAVVYFTTSADCDASNVAVDNISFHSADITWDGSSDAGYTVSYRTAAHFAGINEEFATSSLPTGWETKSGLLSSVMGGTALTSGSGWGTNSYALGTYNVKLNIYGTSIKNWLITPATLLPAGVVLNFDMALTDFNNSDPIEDNTAQADDRFVVLISTDNMASWTILREWNNSGSIYVYNNIATAGEHVTIDLSAYAATNVRIAFYGESTEAGGDNDLHIDNVVFGTPVAAGAWQSVDVASSPATIEDLEDGTAYEVKVSPICDPSIETIIAEFTTVALPTFNVSANNWYALSSPMHDAGQTYESVANVKNITTGTYDFLRYDEPSSTWESQKSGAGHTGFSTLEPGRGYIYRRANDAVLKIDGEPNTANVDVAITKDVDGWNLIGNPFMVPIRLNSTYMASSSTAVLTSGGYKLSTNGMWTAITSSTDIAVGQAVLVKATTAGTLTLRKSASKSAASEEENGQGFLFSLSNDVYSDVAYAMFADGEGLPKISHLNPEAPMLSIDGYAIAMMEQGVERFPLSVSGQGKYTLALKENSADATYLHLIDRATGRDIDLLATPEYTFMANGQADRFEVRLMPGMDENGNVNFVYIDGTRLIVDGEGELQVFDVMGRQLGSAQVAGTATLDRSALGIVSAGVYVVRLGGNSQKIVVK